MKSRTHTNLYFEKANSTDDETFYSPPEIDDTERLKPWGYNAIVIKLFITFFLCMWILT